MENKQNWELQFEGCIYSDRLLDKLLFLMQETGKKVDIVEIKKAIFYARKYHGNQKRQSGEPYYSHPLEVAYMISSYLLRTDIIVTSILHDTLEDTELTFEMIETIFGKIVANQVMDLTRIKEDGEKISSAVMVESLWIQKKYDLLLIKQFDRLHNMQTIGAKSPEKIKKIVVETLNSFLILATYLGIKEPEEELRQLCAKIIAPNKYHLQNKKTFMSDNFQLPSLSFQNDKHQM